jgi:hypothetical protein
MTGGSAGLGLDAISGVLNAIETRSAGTAERESLGTLCDRELPKSALRESRVALREIL